MEKLEINSILELKGGLTINNIYDLLIENVLNMMLNCLKTPYLSLNILKLKITILLVFGLRLMKRKGIFL